MRNLILIAGSVIALGMGGAGVTAAADTSDTSGPDRPAMSGMPEPSKARPDLSEDDIRQAQRQLRAQHLYKGPIDGAFGERTKQAVRKYQNQNGLSQTGKLDQATTRSLLADRGIAGSSVRPSSSERATGLMTNPHPELLGTSRPHGSTAPY